MKYVFGFAVLVMGPSLTGCASTWDGSVGAVFARSASTGRVTVREAPQNRPAALAGLREHDEILSIDTRDVAGLSPLEIRKMLRGKVGTKVHIVWLRDKERMEADVERGPFKP